MRARPSLGLWVTLALAGCPDGDKSDSSSDTTGTLPPRCESTQECAGGDKCLNKPCDVVMDEPGCGEFRCYPECSSPFDESASWVCADNAACCGGYPCLAGMCTEMASSG